MGTTMEATNVHQKTAISAASQSNFFCFFPRERKP